MDGWEEHDPAGIALEKNIAALEGGSYALVFSSGLAACCAITKLLHPGDHLLVSEDIYGSAYHLIGSILASYKVSVSYVDTANIEEVKKAIRKNTKLLWLESPSNPLLLLADIKELADLAQQHKIITVVDNTLATPCSQKPLSLGADIVLHNSVKYLSGRTDIIAGAIVTNRQHLFERLQSHRHAFSDSVEPIDCFGILKGLRTIADRVKQQEKSAKKIAIFLSGHSSVQAVYYPGLPSHDQHQLACKQMSGFGSTLVFELKNGSEAAIRLLREIKLFALPEIVDHADPDFNQCAQIRSTISHAKVPFRVQEKDKLNGAETVVRLTIALENVDDLINELATAMQAVDHQLVQFPESIDLRECI
jgi:cystathionine beta-lyase/cystathionine gamma-synthase